MATGLMPKDEAEMRRERDAAADEAAMRRERDAAADEAGRERDAAGAACAGAAVGAMGASEAGSAATEPPSGPVAAPPGQPAGSSSAARAQLGRSRLRQQKMKMTFFGYIVVLTLFAALQLLGVVTFTHGFLLSRTVLPAVADAAAEPALAMAGGARHPRMVLLVVDALRFDFAVPVPESALPCHNAFPVLHRMAQQHPANALLLKFLADPPTTTLQRLKGLTTGSLPTFVDAGSNFGGDAIDEDNWVLQLHAAGRRVAFMGDDTWAALFRQYLDPEHFYPYPSLNVHDLHTVDNGVEEHLWPLMERGGWDVLIGHFLGVDHVGHKHGPTHSAMRPKLSQMNAVVERVIAEMDSDTLLVVIGDHGMDATGNHGGDSRDELESTLFMYSKRGGFERTEGHYGVEDAGRHHRAVNQIDLVPTLSLLLGLPIPHNNLGSPIREAMGRDYAEAAYKTSAQVERFRRAAGLDGDEVLNEWFAEIRASAEGGGSGSGRDPGGFGDAELSEKFQARFLAQCRSMWATFDLPLIAVGVATLVASLTFIATYSRLIPSVRVSTMSFEFIGSAIAMVLLGLVSSSSVWVVLRPRQFSFRRCASFGVIAGLVVGLWAPIMDRFSVAWLWHQLHDFFIYNFNGWSVLATAFIAIHTLIFASNSFVVWEDKMVSFFLQTFGWYCLAQCHVKLRGTRERTLGAVHAATFIVVSRVVSSIALCREEQQPYCRSNFAMSWPAVAGLYVVAVVLPRMVKAFYALSDSYHSAAPLWIGTCLTFLLFANAVYWSLAYVETAELGAAVAWLDGWRPGPPAVDRVLEVAAVATRWASVAIVTGAPLIASLKLAIARISTVVTLVLANYSWSRGPLCVKLVGPERPAGGMVILGFQNVYGSSYFLLVLNFAVAIMLVSKPLAAISLAMLLVQLLTLLELFQMLRLRENLIAPTMFGLLAYQHFFSTGHQATIPSIQWDAGFVTTDSIVFPFTHLSIALNTLGSFVLVCLSVPLITLWRITPSAKPITVLSQVVLNVTSLMTYQTALSVSSFFFAGHFRRHLMVWKIFAPRFMLSGILLVVMDVLMIVLTLWFGTGKLMTQVNRIFGK
ncbi:GPI ethanolamine phosphate transferase 3 [[Candida] zeylanoides]